MRFLELARTHFLIAARHRALWAVSAVLALLSLSITVNTGLAFESGNVVDLAFTAQMLAIITPIAYAAAFTDLASEPARLGIDEVEASASVPSAQLEVARVTGALSVMVLPSAAVLLFCGCGQMLHGNPWGIVQSMALFAGVVVPQALLAAALSSLAGSLLPRALARIAAVAVWCVALFATSFHGVAVQGGGTQFHIVSDAVCQAFFGCAPYLDYQGPATAATPFEALVLLVAKFALAAAVLAAASAIAKHRNLRRG